MQREDDLPREPAVILMADDDADDRMLARDAMNEAGLANPFFLVEDGQELMDFLRHDGRFATAPRPGLILLDLNMPRVDGRQALRLIKTDPDFRSIPVVILTTSK